MPPENSKRKRYKIKPGWHTHLYIYLKNEYTEGNKTRLKRDVELTDILIKRMADVAGGKWTGSGTDKDIDKKGTNFFYMTFLFKYEDRKKMFKFLYSPIIKKRIKADKTAMYNVDPYW